LSGDILDTHFLAFSTPSTKRKQGEFSTWLNKRPGAAAYICNSRFLEVEIGLQFNASPGKKLGRPYFEKQVGCGGTHL
jgi:hypothetical protein